MSQTHFTGGLWADAWYRLSRNKLALLSGFYLLIICSACFLAPLFSSHSYEVQNLSLGAVAPNGEHWLGTDYLGRDMLSRIFYGGRISFLVGFLATFVSIVVGVVYGAVSGYLGGRIDRFMMRVVEILYAMPYIIFVILLVLFFGRQLWLIFVAIGLVQWLTMARIIRGQVLLLKEQQFVLASRALGQSHVKILTKHILPNLFGTIIVYATLTVPSVMLQESFLSFLGLGVQPPMTSWGDLINNGVSMMEESPWLLIFPSLFFAMTLFSLNFFGDGLRDAFDPRASK